MSRSGYTDDHENNWQLICWRGAVASSIRGRRGQAFLRELLTSLDAMPEKRLITGDFFRDGDCCALGAVARTRGVGVADIDPEDFEAVAPRFNIADALAREIMYENDDVWRKESPEQRFDRIRRWVVASIKELK